MFAGRCSGQGHVPGLPEGLLEQGGPREGEPGTVEKNRRVPRKTGYIYIHLSGLPSSVICVFWGGVKNNRGTLRLQGDKVGDAVEVEGLRGLVYLSLA